MKKNKNKVHILPLGGLEEVGKNMMVIEYKNELIIIDCGLRFSTPETPGIDFMVNDFSYVINNASKLKAVVITHGHLDHIGSLGYLLEKVTCPVFCTDFTRKLIAKILDEKHGHLKVSYKKITPGNVFEIGSFSIEGIRVNHSIIDAMSLAITTPAGVLIHTGDWRIDEKPTYESKIDIERFKAYGKKGVLCLFSDSTNAVKEGYNVSESIISQTLENIFLTAKARILIATFSTQVTRIKEIINLAKVFNRKVAVVGRSMINMISVSLRFDVLEDSDLFVDIKSVNDLDPSKVVILTTGTQGEERAGLILMAQGQHKHVKLNKKDTVILSSSFIPGNEFPIKKLLNHLHKNEINVITSKDMEIHTSGHASKEELKDLIGWVNPTYFVPIHGESIQLVHHKKLAMEKGIAEKNIFVIDNGTKLELSESGAKIIGRINLKGFYTVGANLFMINDTLFKERLELCEHGAVSLNIMVKELKLCHLEISTKGLIDRDTDHETLKEIQALIAKIIEAHLPEMYKDKKKVELKIKKELRRYFLSRLNKSPLVFFHVLVY